LAVREGEVIHAGFLEAGRVEHVAEDLETRRVEDGGLVLRERLDRLRVAEGVLEAVQAFLDRLAAAMELHGDLSERQAVDKAQPQRVSDGEVAAGVALRVWTVAAAGHRRQDVPRPLGTARMQGAG